MNSILEVLRTILNTFHHPEDRMERPQFYWLMFLGACMFVPLAVPFPFGLSGPVALTIAAMFAVGTIWNLVPPIVATREAEARNAHSDGNIYEISPVMAGLLYYVRLRDGS